MLFRWRRVPWWVLAVVLGALYGGVSGVVRVVFDHQGWSDALISGGISAVPFGAGMGYFAKIQRDRGLATLGDLDDADQDLALRAARGGPPPADSAVREAATRFVDYRLDILEHQGTTTLVVLGVAAVVCACLALFTSPWWWLMGALAATVALSTRLQARQLRRRRAVLHGADQAQSGRPR